MLQNNSTNIKKEEKMTNEKKDMIHKSIEDLGAAAYVMMHGFKVVGKKGKNVYFEVPNKEEKEFEKLVFDYLSSEYHRFDSCLMSLKKIGDYNHI